MTDNVEPSHLLLSSQPSHATTKHRASLLLATIWHDKRYYLYLLPVFLLLGIFSYFPPLSAFYYSFFKVDARRIEFIGLDNFANLVRDAKIWASTGNVFMLLIANLFTGIVPSLFVAELLFFLRSRRGGNFYRSMFLVPILVPTMVVVLTWRYVYHPSYGLINWLLANSGLGSLQHDWLGSYDTALLSLMFFGFPWIHGTNVLILLAALLNIPEEVLDSYRLDAGAGIRRLWYLDLPLIAGAIRLLLIMAISGSLQGLTLQFAMTAGGPGIATMVPAYYMYQQAFSGGRFGYASAIGVVLFVVIMAATLANLRLVRSDVEYQARGGGQTR